MRTNNNIEVGFWRDEESSTENLPFPIKRKNKRDIDFLALLKEVESKAKKLRWRGFSKCRLCGQINGSISYVYNGFEWPSGLRHYVEEHNIDLPDNFVLMVKPLICKSK